MILQKWDACVFKSVKTFFEIELMVKLLFITNVVYFRYGILLNRNSQ